MRNHTESGSIPGLDPHQTLYGYVPTEWVCALFIALFGLSTLIHIAQAAKVRTLDDASRVMLNVIISISYGGSTRLLSLAAFARYLAG
jgi:hypothetical protein